MRGGLFFAGDFFRALGGVVDQFFLDVIELGQAVDLRIAGGAGDAALEAVSDLRPEVCALFAHPLAKRLGSLEKYRVVQQGQCLQWSV